MSAIIAGRVALQTQVQKTIDELRRAGFPQDRIASFYVNPPGQHDIYPFGGDYEKSPGAEKTDKGAVEGLLAGDAAGLVTLPVVGPIGPLVGAYIGALIGGLAETNEVEESSAPDGTPPERKSGLLVAVAAGDPEHQRIAAATLNSAGATDIEIADGTIENNDWTDFDPLVPPKLLKPVREAQMQTPLHRGSS